MITTKVIWPDVETAFERNVVGLESYIDRQTGEVIAVLYHAQEDRPKRAEIETNPENFIKIEPASSRDQYRWMEHFVATVEEAELRDQLFVCIDGKGAFRRFKDTLLNFPLERERWFSYRADLLRHYINMWMREKGIIPDPPPPWGDIELPPEPVLPESRSSSEGEGPADVLRKQIKSLVDGLPAGELHACRVFVEYLRDRGSVELQATRGKIDLTRSIRRTYETNEQDERDSSDGEGSELMDESTLRISGLV